MIFIYRKTAAKISNYSEKTSSKTRKQMARTALPAGRHFAALLQSSNDRLGQPCHLHYCLYRHSHSLHPDRSCRQSLLLAFFQSFPTTFCQTILHAFFQTYALTFRQSFLSCIIQSILSVVFRHHILLVLVPSVHTSTCQAFLSARSRSCGMSPAPQTRNAGFQSSPRPFHSPLTNTGRSASHPFLSLLPLPSRSRPDRRGIPEDEDGACKEKKTSEREKGLTKNRKKLKNQKNHPVFRSKLHNHPQKSGTHRPAHFLHISGSARFADKNAFRTDKVSI